MGMKSGITSIGKLREPVPADEEARKRLGDYFVAVLLLDQGTIAAKADAQAPSI